MLKPIDNSLNVSNEKSISLKDKQREENYVFFRSLNESTDKGDEHDLIIDEYIRTTKTADFKDALLFWKCHSSKFPELSVLAKKYLGVQASSASVERMFNFAGHIFQNKRRKTGIKLFENLVFLKLMKIFYNYTNLL